MPLHGPALCLCVFGLGGGFLQTLYVILIFNANFIMVSVEGKQI